MVVGSVVTCPSSCCKARFSTCMALARQTRLWLLQACRAEVLDSIVDVRGIHSCILVDRVSVAVWKSQCSCKAETVYGALGIDP